MYKHQINIEGLGVLDLVWVYNWSFLMLTMRGESLRIFGSKEELLAGQSVALPDGREIYVHHDGKNLNIWLDGKELLSGKAKGDFSPWDYDNAVLAIFGFGILGIIIGLFILFSVKNDYEINALRVLLIVDLLVSGCILIALGFWAKYTYSKIPLYIALAIALVSIALLSINGANIGVVIIGFFMYYLFKGIRVLPSKERRREKIDMHGPLDANN